MKEVSKYINETLGTNARLAENIRHKIATLEKTKSK
jgi:hypothetical protein